MRNEVGVVPLQVASSLGIGMEMPRFSDWVISEVAMRRRSPM